MSCETDHLPYTSKIERALLNGIAGGEVLLIRHAEPGTAENDECLDPPLSETGERQAQLLAQRLRAEGGVGRIYSSPLRRARQTAGILADELDRPVVEVYDLREVELRRQQRGGSDPIRLLSPDEIRQRFQESGRWDAFPCAEPSAEFRARVRRAIDTIRAMNPGRRVAIVCHGGVINAYLADLLVVPRDIFFLPRHTSLSVIRTLGDTSFLDRLNDARHLEGTGPDSGETRLTAARH